MAGERIKLEVKERERRGSADSRRLRNEGFIPGVLYGRGKTPHAIFVPERDLRRALTGAGGLHAILDVVLEGQKTTHASILKELPAGSDPRAHLAHRPAGGPARRADPGRACPFSSSASPSA